MSRRAKTRQNQQSGMCPREVSDQSGHPPSRISFCCPHEADLGLEFTPSAKSLITEL